MRGKDLLRDIEYIDESLIEEAKEENITKIVKKPSKSKASKKRMWISIASAAAVLCISIGTLKLTETKYVNEGISVENTMLESGNSINDKIQQPVEELAKETDKVGNAEVTNEQNNEVLDKSVDLKSEKDQLQMKESDVIQISPPAEMIQEADLPALIKINGVVYYDSGEISNEARCGVMDGGISVKVDGIPEEDNQSNFGTGYGYQFWPGRIDVLIDDEWHMFYPYEAEKVYDLTGEKATYVDK